MRAELGLRFRELQSPPMSCPSGLAVSLAVIKGNRMYAHSESCTSGDDAGSTLNFTLYHSSLQQLAHRIMLARDGQLIPLPVSKHRAHKLKPMAMHLCVCV